MVYGYARVSTSKQVKGNSLQEQKDLLMQAGVPEENIICDVYTGTKTERPEFTKLIEHLQAGDKLVVTKMDRFARTAAEGSVLVKELNEKGVVFHILNMGTADNSSMGKLMVHLLLAFAEFERDMIVERTQAGKAIARANGVRVDGRPEKYAGAQISHAMELLNNHSYTEVERMTGISRSTLTRARRKMKAMQAEKE